MPLLVLLFCLSFFVAGLSAQTKGSRVLLPDGSSVETSTFVEQKKIEKRFYDKKDTLLKIAIYNTDANGKSLRSAVYDPKGKLRYWERFFYAEDGKTCTEVKVFSPAGELIMKTTFEGGKPKVVDGAGRVLSESEWKSLR